MRQLAVVVLLGIAVACGQQESEESASKATPETAYGSVQELLAYRDAIEPHIRQVGQVTAQVQAAAGSAGRVTVANLAPPMEAGKPRLQAALDGLEAIEPPAAWRDFHQTMRAMVEERVQACEVTLAAWRGGDAAQDTSWHRQVEHHLQQADQLSLELNEQLQRLDTAIRTGAPPQQVAAP